MEPGARRGGSAARCVDHLGSWLLLSGSFDEADDDVVGVTVEVAAGPVIPRGHAGVAVPRGDLDITQRDTCVKAGGDGGYLP